MWTTDLTNVPFDSLETIIQNELYAIVESRLNKAE